MKKITLSFIFLFLFSILNLINVNDSKSQWLTSLSSAGQIWTVTVNPVNQQIIYAGSNTTGIWKTTNGGVNWAQSNAGLTNLSVQTSAISKSNPNVVYCGTSQTGTGAGIYKSTDAGGNWIQINSGITETSLGIQSIAVDPTDPNVAYVAVFDGVIDSPTGLYKTINGGANWTPSINGIGTVKNFLTIIINPLNKNVVYCGTSFGVTSQMGPPHIYRSNDAGGLWTDISTGLPSLTTDNKPVRCLSIGNPDTSLILAGLFLNTDSLSGMYVTTNSGGLWTRRHTGLPNAVGTLPRSCLINTNTPGEFYVGLGNSTNTAIGVFRTTNSGLSWADYNNGTLANNTSIRSLALRTNGNILYAGGAHPTLATSQGVFERQLPTGISNQNQSAPENFLLKQNYPNPFNPNTNISYLLPEESKVVLSIFDITGKRIKDMVNGKQPGGSYEINFDASSLSSGVYYYKISVSGSSGEFSDTKLMMFIK